MFSMIEAKNYKAFSHLTLDLYRNKQAKTIKNMASIYGENGSGKSSIIYLFEILIHSLHTIQTFNNVLELRNKMVHNNEEYKEIDIKKVLLNSSFTNLPKIVKDCQMIGSDEPMKLVYYFILNGKSGYYTLAFNKENQLIYEKMNFVINSNVGTMYKIMRHDHEIKYEFSKSVIKNESLLKDLGNAIEKNWGLHSFLAILNDFKDNVNVDYIYKNVNSNLFTVINFFENIGYSAQTSTQVKMPQRFLSGFLPAIVSGKIAIPDLPRLENTEIALDTFFTELYADIKEVKYDIREEGNQILYNLFIYKLIEGKIRKIPFKLESRGTKKLANILYILLSATAGNVVAVDEIDEGIHDLTIQSALESTLDSLGGQLIFTTHNTFLMQHFEKSNMYLINIDAQGKKSITSLDHFQTQTNHNIQNQYLKGYFGGTPYPGSIDFAELLEDE